jgi:hypothetical protein
MSTNFEVNYGNKWIKYPFHVFFSQKVTFFKNPELFSGCGLEHVRMLVIIIQISSYVAFIIMYSQYSYCKSYIVSSFLCYGCVTALIDTKYLAPVLTLQGLE